MVFRFSVRWAPKVVPLVSDRALLGWWHSVTGLGVACSMEKIDLVGRIQLRRHRGE